MESRTVIALARKWKWGETANRNQFLKVLFGIKDSTETVVGELFFTEKTITRTLESLALMGWEGSELDELLPGGIGRLDVNPVELVLERGTWIGRDGIERPDQEEKVKWINAIGDKHGKTSEMEKPDLDVSTVKSFSEQMKDRVMALQLKAGRSGTTQARATKNAQPRPQSSPPQQRVSAPAADPWLNGPPEGLTPDDDIEF